MISSVLTLGLAPVSALADTSAELQTKVDAAKANLDNLYNEAADASENLNQTKVELDDVNQQIDQNTQDIQAQQEVLAAKQSVLAGRVHDNYTSGGGTSLLSIVLGSSSFEDLWQNIYYSNKISEEDAQAIADVKDAKAQLEAKESELEQNKAQKEELVNTQQEQVNELNAKSAEAQDYYNGLSQELQDAIAAEQAAAEEAARQQAEAEAAAAAEAAAQVNADSTDSGTTATTTDDSGAAATTTDSTPAATTNTDNGASQQQATTNTDNGASQQQTNTNTTTNTTTNTNTNTNNGGTQRQTTNTNTSTNTNTNTTTKTTTTKTTTNTSQNLGGSARSIIVAAAYAQVGCAYVYGAASPGVAFDCSGLVMYCYAQAGISLPHSSASLAAYCNKSASQAQAGDIMWKPGHVGICVGNGVTIEAMNPYMGVTFGTTSDFVSCGSPAA